MEILEKLKTETSELHSQLETSHLLRQLTSGHLTLDVYTQILHKFFGFFSPLEQQILSYSEELKTFLPDLQERRKAKWLLRDLSVLDRAGKSEQPVKLCDDLPDITNVAAAIGCLYVMEGSTLGGRIISKNLNRSIGLDDQTGAGFFGGYGPKTGERWTGFKMAVRNFYNANPTAEEEILSAANSTFQKFYYWLNSTNE